MAKFRLLFDCFGNIYTNCSARYERYIKQILDQPDEKLREKALKRLRKRNLIPILIPKYM